MDVIVKGSPNIKIGFEAKVIKVEGSGGGKVTVDSSLSTTSENPVQNKVITQELNKKVDKEEGKGLSTNDYTDEDKERVSYGGVVISDEDSLWNAAIEGSKYGPIVNFTDPENDTAMLNGVYHIVDFSFESRPYVKFVAIVKDDWTGDIYLMNIYYDRAYGNHSITRKKVNSILTAEQFATQAEIDAIFEGNSGGSSSSY